MNKTSREIHDLAWLGHWDAAYRFQSGDAGGAVGDLAALEAMGRSGDVSLAGLRLEDSVHSGAIQLLAENAGDIFSVAQGDIAYILSPGVAEQSFRAGLESEAAIQKALLDEYNNPATRSASALQRWGSGGYDATTGVEAKVAEAEWRMTTEQALETTLAESDEEFRAWWVRQFAEIYWKTGADETPQILAAVRGEAKKWIVTSAMLNAGLALEQNNQAGFQSILDPASGKPFAYTQTATGFELASAMLDSSGPVKLSFSTPAGK